MYQTLNQITLPRDKIYYHSTIKCNHTPWSNGFAHFLSNTADKRQKQSNFDNSFYTSGYLRFRNKLQIPPTQIITYFPLDARFLTLLHLLSRWYNEFFFKYVFECCRYILVIHLIRDSLFHCIYGKRDTISSLLQPLKFSLGRRQDLDLLWHDTYCRIK